MRKLITRHCFKYAIINPVVSQEEEKKDVVEDWAALAVPLKDGVDRWSHFLDTKMLHSVPRAT